MKLKIYTQVAKPYAQKWGLFIGLLGILGTNVNWDTQLGNITRNQNTIYSTHMASQETMDDAARRAAREARPAPAPRVETSQTVAPAATTVAPAALSTTTVTGNDTWTVYDLGMIDARMKKLILEVVHADGCKPKAVLKKKSDTEGASATTADCEFCGLKELKPAGSCETGAAVSSTADVLKWMLANEKALKTEAEANKDSKQKSVDSKVASCEGMKGSELIDCQKEVYESLAETCHKKSKEEIKADRQAGREPVENDCFKRMDKAFAAIKTAYATCSKKPVAGKKDDDIGFGGSARSNDLDCDSIEEFAKTTVLPNASNFGHVSASLQFLGKLATNGMTAEAERLKASGLQPFQINQALGTAIDRNLGTSSRTYNYQTGQWEFGRIPTDGTNGREIFDALLDNPNFASPNAALKGFDKYMYGPFVEVRKKQLANPASNTIIGMEPTAPADMSALLAARPNTGSTVPALPQMANVRSRGTGATGQLLSPAQQRGLAPIPVRQ